ncbi:MAG: restriction endonuclease subunit S [Nitrospirales bacterium]
MSVAKYIPLTFVSSLKEKERLILNTMLIHHYGMEVEEDVALSYYIEGTQYGFNASAKDEGVNRFVRISDIKNGGIDWDNVPFCDCDDPSSYLLKDHDIIVARTGGTTGKSDIVHSPPKGSVYAGYLIRIRANAETNPTFISIFLNSYFYWEQITSLNRDEFRPSVNAKKLSALRLPKFSRLIQDEIARLANSTRQDLASIIPEITPVIAATQAQKSLEGEILHQQSLLVKLKQVILQEAIQGKLTEDWRAANPDIEPAGKLLQRIKDEKVRLIAEKKIRKEKPLPKINPEEIPFEIPEGWVWCRLLELSEKTGSGSTPSGGKSAYSDSGIPFLRSQNVHNTGLVLKDVARISDSIHERMSNTTVFPDDLLLNITGGSIGRCSIVTNKVKEANVNQHVAIIRPVDRSFGQYLHSIIISPYFQEKIEDAQTGAGREGLPKNKMDRIPIPLPPLAEQAVIIERVEALMATCQKLESEIEHSRNHAANLLQAVLKEAFAPANT